MPSFSHSEDNDDWLSWLMGETKEVDLRIIVPKGIVMAFKKDNPNELVWQKKVGELFSS